MKACFGPSPRAIAAMQDAAADVWMYGDPENHDLKQALAAHHGCTPGHVAVGAGHRRASGPDLPADAASRATPVVTSLGAYPTFNFHVAGFGGTLHARALPGRP